MFTGIGTRLDSVLPHGRVGIDRVMLLSEIPDFEPVTSNNSSFPIASLDACEELKEGRLSSTVITQNNDAGTLVDG